MTSLTFRYVRLHEVNTFAELGWERTPILDKTHHGQWSAMMQWKGEGEEKVPEGFSAPATVGGEQ